jgi:hypothetical protein
MTQPTRQNRLYGMMQFLMATAANGAKPTPAPQRNIVTQQDALNAVLGLAAAIDQPTQAGTLPKTQGDHMGEMLMVIREFIQSLPEGTAAHGGPDLATADLQSAVDEIRATSQASGIEG